jgi:drug/metabolite transporter (DMT)-like permease
LANVVAKRYASQIDPAANVLVQAVVGAFVLLSVAALSERNAALRFTSIAIAATLYLGIVGSALAFVGLYWLLTKSSATNVSLFSFLTPIIAVILGRIILKETLDPNVGLGTVLILAGVYLTIRPTHEQDRRWARPTHTKTTTDQLVSD